MDVKVTNSIRETLGNVQHLSQSLSSKLLPIDGPWHLCDCEKPEQFVLIDSQKALEYLNSHSIIHILSEEGLKFLNLSYPKSSNVVAIPLSFDRMNLGILLIEVHKSEKNMTEKLPFFDSLSSIVGSSIGNALKVCMLNRLDRVSRLFLEKMELNDRLQKIVDGTRQVFGEEFHCEIYLNDPVEEKLYLRASTLVGPEQYDYYTISSNVGINGWVLEHQKIEKFTDVPNDPRAVQGHVRKNHVKSAGVAPITFHGQELGVLNVVTTENKNFVHEDMWVLDMLAQYAGIALHNSMIYEQMEEMAMIDPVSGAFSRRYFYDKAEQQLALVKRNETPLSVLMIDIDFFKKVNDKHGHHTGDVVLQQLYQSIEKSIRLSDVCGRYGGEEFAVLLPNVTQKKAVIIAERICKNVERYTSPTVTVSIGIASFQSTDTSIEDLLQRADKALYKSKENGRNQVTIYDPYLM
jgi:diguanylate cyclase (GGDEF)-like protein